MDINKELKNIRMSLGLSMQDIADKMGTTKMTVSNIENNKTQSNMSFERYKQTIMKLVSPKVITICGSMRFLPVMLQVYTKLSAEGNVVFLPGLYDYSGEYIPDTNDVMLKLTPQPFLTQEVDNIFMQRRWVHQSKMLMSDSVVVVCPGKYIGKDTMAEVYFAKENSIPIIYLDSPTVFFDPRDLGL